MAIPQPGQARLVTGIKNVHVTELTADAQSGTPTYDTPVILSGATNSLNITDNVNTAIYYGDNRSVATSIAKGNMEVTIGKQDLDQDQEAYILGKSVVNGYVIDHSDDVPPYVGIMYELTYDDGASKFVLITKARFQEPAPNGTSKTDTVEFQEATFVAQAVARLSDGVRKRTRIVPATQVDTFRTTFFGNANDATPTALSITTSPSDGATGVAVDAAITVTFNNDIQLSTLAGNIALAKDDGTSVPVTLSLDSTNRIITVGHADLDATSTYILFISDNLRDVFGQGSQTIVNFTTA